MDNNKTIECKKTELLIKSIVKPIDFELVLCIFVSYSYKKIYKALNYNLIKLKAFMAKEIFVNYYNADSPEYVSFTSFLLQSITNRSDYHYDEIELKEQHVKYLELRNKSNSFHRFLDQSVENILADIRKHMFFRDDMESINTIKRYLLMELKNFESECNKILKQKNFIVKFIKKNRMLILSIFFSFICCVIYSNYKINNDFSSFHSYTPVSSTYKTFDNQSLVKGNFNEKDFYFVGSINSDKYHEPNCPSAENISAENYTTFNSIEEAESDGYIPCQRCHPDSFSKDYTVEKQFSNIDPLPASLIKNVNNTAHQNNTLPSTHLEKNIPSIRKYTPANIPSKEEIDKIVKESKNKTEQIIQEYNQPQDQDIEDILLNSSPQ